MHQRWYSRMEARSGQTRRSGANVGDPSTIRIPFSDAATCLEEVAEFGPSENMYVVLRCRDVPSSGKDRCRKMSWRVDRSMDMREPQVLVPNP